MLGTVDAGTRDNPFAIQPDWHISGLFLGCGRIAKGQQIQLPKRGSFVAWFKANTKGAKGS